MSPHFYVSTSVFAHIGLSLSLKEDLPFAEGKKARGGGGEGEGPTSA